MRQLAHQPPEALVEPLTRREREVLAFLAQGLTSPEIAAQLSLATNSVKFHRQNLYGKLGVHNKRQALARAEKLGLLRAAPAPSPAPTLAAAPPGPRHNLPLQNTRFFGREAEITQLQERLAENRLVTLTGSGGVGKTRLSLGVAAAVLADFSGGVWSVELAGLADPALVPLQVASTLDLSKDSHRPVLERLIDHLHQRQTLLVLDNCEHLLPACALLAEALLRACPQLQILATSREALGVPGEALYRVPSLPFPDPQALPPLEKLDDFTALRLFVDRARLVRPDYAITPANAVALARICQRLDGIPLAIEMAAARVDIFSTAELAARLDDVFRLLTAGSRTALPRHQTLRAAIDWSYQLLSEPERRLLQSLSVFGGGCTLAAAEAVCAGDGLVAAAVIDQLASLFAKSMVIITRPAGQAVRYHLLEMVRQFAREKLDQSGDTQMCLARHRDYFVSLAEAALNGIMELDPEPWAWQIFSNFDNLRLGLAWAFSEPSGEKAPDAGLRLVQVLVYVGYFAGQEGLDWTARALAWCRAHPEVPATHYARMAAHHARLLSEGDLLAGTAALNQAVEFSRSLGPAGQLVYLFNLMDFGNVLAGQDEAEAAQAAYAEAEALLKALGPASFTPGEYMLHQGFLAAAQASLANRLGRSQAALAYAAQCLTLVHASQFNWFAWHGFIEAGQAYLDLRQYEAARAQFLEARAFFERIEHAGTVGQIEERLGLVEVGLGNLAQAQAHCRRCLQLAQFVCVVTAIAAGLGLAALIAAHPDSASVGSGQRSRAAQLAGASQALLAGIGRKPWPRAALDTLLPGWRDWPEHAAVHAAFAAGQAMDSDAAVAYALSESNA